MSSKLEKEESSYADSILFSKAPLETLQLQAISWYPMLHFATFSPFMASVARKTAPSCASHIFVAASISIADTVSLLLVIKLGTESKNPVESV